MKRLQHYFIILVLTSFSFASHAALTPEKVKNWLEVVPALEQWSTENGSVMEAYEEKAANLSESDAEALLKNQPFYPELDALLSQYGFSGVSELKNTSLEIFGTAMGPEMIAQIEQGLAQSESMLNDDMFDEEVKKGIQQSHDAMTAMLNYAKNSTDADRQAIEPYKEQIAAMMQ
jgi:hypothetical protein